MTSIQKQALKDAQEYARAQMFYGEGAGNRRKLINKTVEAKSNRFPIYAVTFSRELARQDMAEHARRARRERKRIDLSRAFNKNVRNAAAGNYTGVNAVVLVIGGVGYYAHKTGYDKVIYEKARKKYAEVKNMRIFHRDKVPMPRITLVTQVDTRKPHVTNI
jgi:hypothetical protein